MKNLTLFTLTILCLAGCGSNPVVGSGEPRESAAYCSIEIAEQAAEKQPSFSLNKISLKQLSPVEISEYLKLLYEEDGHLYTTLEIAKAAKFDMKRALMISYYSQYPDIDLDYEATPVAIKSLLWPPAWDWRDDITGRLHSLHGGDSNAIKARRNELAATLKQTLLDEDYDWLSGLLIHAMGDSYAHTKKAFRTRKEKAYGRIIGHAVPTLLGRSPDKICREANTAKYVGYVKALSDVFRLPPSTTVITPNCEDKERSPFEPDINWAGITEENVNEKLAGKPTARFVHCMNRNSRQLTKAEVLTAIHKITTGLPSR